MLLAYMRACARALDVPMHVLCPALSTDHDDALEWHLWQAARQLYDYYGLSKRTANLCAAMRADQTGEFVVPSMLLIGWLRHCALRYYDMPLSRATLQPEIRK